jgi:predicted NBD/HSP70 family sugar kinase
VAVSRNTWRLLKKKIIRECEAESSDMGRKPIPVELRGDFCYVLGVDVVGGTLKVALANLLGEIVKYHEEPIQHNDEANALMERMLKVLSNIIKSAKVPKEKIWTVTVGAPGVFYPEEGKSRFSAFLDDWENIDIRARISKELSIETFIDNDVNLDVIAESWKGVGKDYENILYVKLGQGLAARVLINNKLVRGEHNMAGEIGFMLPGSSSQNPENYESLLRNSAVCENYRNMGGKTPVMTISDLCNLANDGDDIALTVVNRMLDNFAVVLINSAAVLDPQVIILGGDAVSFGEKEITQLKQKIQQYLPFIQDIIISKLDKNACLYGAIKTGLDRIEERISEIW